jgi:hypothetical protein
MHLLQHFSFLGGIQMLLHIPVGVKASVKRNLKLLDHGRYYFYGLYRL